MTTPNPDLPAALGRHPFLRGLPEDALGRLAALARVATFPKGAFVLREGHAADALYLLVEGRVALEVATPAQAAQVVETLEGGDILGLHWLFPPRRWVLDARVVQRVTALVLDATSLRALLDADPSIGQALALRLLEQTYERLARVRLQRLDVYRSAQ